MPVRICEAEPGGSIRYEWTDGKGNGFYLTGECVELEPFHKIVHVERMHLPTRPPTTVSRRGSRGEGDGTLSRELRMSAACSFGGLATSARGSLETPGREGPDRILEPRLGGRERLWLAPSHPSAVRPRRRGACRPSQGILQ